MILNILFGIVSTSTEDVYDKFEASSFYLLSLNDEEFPTYK
jgi:hypothetical protein